MISRTLQHDTGQVIGRPGISDPVSFYARPLVSPGTDIDWTSARVQISTTWAPPPTGLDAHELLVSGLLAYGDEDFNQAVLDLHTALDLVTAHQSDQFLPDLGLPTKARTALTLPERLAFIQLQASQKLTMQAQAAIRTLNKLRNEKVAHQGVRLDLTDVAEPTAGAVAVLWWLWSPSSQAPMKSDPLEDGPEEG